MISIWNEVYPVEHKSRDKILEYKDAYGVISKRKDWSRGRNRKETRKPHEDSGCWFKVALGRASLVFFGSFLFYTPLRGAWSESDGIQSKGGFPILTDRKEWENFHKYYVMVGSRRSAKEDSRELFIITGRKRTLQLRFLYILFSPFFSLDEQLKVYKVLFLTEVNENQNLWNFCIRYI